MRTFLRFFSWIVTILFVAAASVFWWFVYRPLPQLDGSISLPGLHAQVTVERDNWGIPHIRATSIKDLAEAQGYVMAQDRLWQMDLLRRVARGQLSEIFGPDTLRFDRQFRTYGFARAANRDLALMDPESRSVMEAYALGVNLFIRTHAGNLPLEFSLLRYEPQPWQPTDSLVISGYMYLTLTNTWESKLDRAKVLERVGPDRARDLFSQDASMDHFVIGDPNVIDDGSQRSQSDSDDNDDDIQPETVLKARLLATAANHAFTAGNYTDLSSALWPSVHKYLGNLQQEIRHGLGSNEWVVSGAHTASGKPLLANDTHLELTIPSIWYEIHLTAPGWNVKGFTLPGAPMVIIGHNDRIAWGFTNNGASVQDLYIESFDPDHPDQYRIPGGWAKAQLIDETIHIKNKPDEYLQAVVTRHGPIVHREAGRAYALRWTATEPGGLSNTYNWLGKARNWREFREIMKNVWGPAQNAVYADVDGNIGYIMAARVPLRKNGYGELPVPGDTDDFEWTGYIPFDKLPQALNPASGFIVTANARVVGPNYKPFLTDNWEEPYRTARIYDLLHDKHDLRPEDMLKVETDTYSFPHVFLADQVSAAAKISPPGDSRALQLIQGLKDWNGIADANSPELSFLESLRLQAIQLLLEPYLGNDTGLYRWRRTAFLQKILTNRPAKWLPPSFKSYDEFLSAAADRAVQDLAARTGSPRIEDWPWKRFDSLDMAHPLGRSAPLKWFLSITGKPQSGTSYSPRAATTHHGPAMRFIANFADWDDSILLIPAGESGQPGSGHYSDQFPYWYEGKPIYAPFSDTAEARVRKHTLTLKPTP